MNHEVSEMTPEKFKAIRLKAGMSQSQLAKRLGVHKQTISNYERGVDPIRPVVALAMFFVEHEYGLKGAEHAV